ncbi:hypothetical protein E05_23080 [Plautia stali symbiont]|nr:hypothetical protein E05_23080 [Plautia stali symbiont]
MKTRLSLCAAALLLTSFVSHAQPEYDQYARGSYIATLADCTACHTADPAVCRGRQVADAVWYAGRR